MKHKTANVEQRPIKCLEHAQAVYADALMELLIEFDAQHHDSSCVEPHPMFGGWIADLRRMGGPILGARVAFATQEAALHEVREWRQHRWRN